MGLKPWGLSVQGRQPVLSAQGWQPAYLQADSGCAGEVACLVQPECTGKWQPRVCMGGRRWV